MFTITHSGSFSNIEKFLANTKRADYKSILDRYGREGVNALSMATPVDSGETARSWNYKIISSKGAFVLEWTNSNVIDGAPIAILIQYGHGTKNGGYVQGRDYINPTLKPIFDKISNDIWKEVFRK